MSRCLLLLALAACTPDPVGTSVPIGATPVDPTTPTPPHPTGTFPEQRLSLDGADRTYLLHVPSGYDGAPVGVLFDFHGTATDRPEEAYGLDGAIAAAEAEGFALVRPRSRSSREGGVDVYRWDQNPGDPERNLEFTHALLDDLRARLAIDEDRIHAMGFSSGTLMVALLAEDPASPFDGFGFVGGGTWHTETQAPRGRVWLATPYRDYMRDHHHTLVEQLDAGGHPVADRLERRSMSGHELYDDMYPELWAWLDRGEAPPIGGALQPGWAASDVPPALAVDDLGQGALLLAGVDTLGTWTDDGGFVPADVDTPLVAELTGVCTTDGHGAAVGGGRVLWTDDDGATWVDHSPLREPGPAQFGFAWWTAVGCHAGEVRGAGYWSAGSTVDGGAWADWPLDLGGYRAQAAAVAVDAAGTWGSAGYYWLDVGGDRAGWGEVGASWVLDLAPTGDGAWVAVGDHGTLARYDGLRWTPVADLGDAVELGAVAFRDDGVGLAVGRAGAAWLSRDAGRSWIDVSLGRHDLLADVRWRADGSALVVGPEASYVYTP